MSEDVAIVSASTLDAAAESAAQAAFSAERATAAAETVEREAEAAIARAEIDAAETIAENEIEIGELWRTVKTQQETLTSLAAQLSSIQAALLQMTDDPRSIGPLFACGGDPLIGAGATGDCALDVWLRRGRDDLVAALDVALARALGATDGGAVCDRAMRVLEVPAARASLPRCQAVLTALCRADKWKRAVARGLPMDGVIV